jgi:hypothetical protein
MMCVHRVGTPSWPLSTGAHAQARFARSMRWSRSAIILVTSFSSFDAMNERVSPAKLQLGG